MESYKKHTNQSNQSIQVKVGDLYHTLTFANVFPYFNRYLCEPTQRQRPEWRRERYPHTRQTHRRCLRHARRQSHVACTRPTRSVLCLCTCLNICTFIWEFICVAIVKVKFWWLLKLRHCQATNVCWLSQIACGSHPSSQVSVEVGCY